MRKQCLPLLLLASCTLAEGWSPDESQHALSGDECSRDLQFSNLSVALRSVDDSPIGQDEPPYARPIRVSVTAQRNGHEISTAELIAEMGEPYLLFAPQRVGLNHDSGGTRLAKLVSQVSDLLVFDVPPLAAGLNDVSIVFPEQLPKKLWQRRVIAAGDANQDYQFDGTDVSQILGSNLYKTGAPAEFSDGDFNGDGVFSPADLVLSLQSGLYQEGHYSTATDPCTINAPQHRAHRVVFEDEAIDTSQGAVIVRARVPADATRTVFAFSGADRTRTITRVSDNRSYKCDVFRTHCAVSGGGSFEVELPEDERIQGLRVRFDRLETEPASALAWAADNEGEYNEHALVIPAGVSSATVYAVPYETARPADFFDRPWYSQPRVEVFRQGDEQVVTKDLCRDQYGPHPDHACTLTAPGNYTVVVDNRAGASNGAHYIFAAFAEEDKDDLLD